ncbi:MAG: 16S rRNA (guanine(966)-N(2))-methyltransferase RsmD [Gammaproteobacteria bacterium]|nr:16S rRNA (guanine(966)-N(2))-methyltransferase RsmD [Gammaproteobacteria bacterium]MCW9032100.1 16S rRNA (guanine(966)-N(2))-methyltransferase RsmD [Gammaproteobacteria bacterium]
MSKGSNQLRIIGGEWRGRKLRFPDAPNLRPTPDRVRETIFNWLMPVIHGARCLDLFAGSGALGLEALSRGAAFTTFVDSHKKATQALQGHLDLLGANTQAEVIHMDSVKFLNNMAQAYSLVFLDPPYHLDFMEKVVPLLEGNGWLAENAMLYLEIEKRQSLPGLPMNWHKLKEKTAGEVNYFLFQRS